jgi:hypothetical protein
MNGSWSFANAEFRRPLILKHSVPRQISFASATFKRTTCSADYEGNYRAWRKNFEEQSDRENEGLFYALEKRSHRASLPHMSVAYWVSRLYDWVSVYGQSYERAISWFFGLQVIMFITYWIGLQHVHAQIVQVVAFTLSQVAKPFELFSAKAPDSEGGLALVSGLTASDRALWGIVGFAHSALSIVLLTIAVLAIRWRFRRA